MTSETIEVVAKSNLLPLTNLYWTSFIAGGIAGFVVDVALFPIDTIKTRLQSENGFFKSGGFRGIYKGLSIAASGSVPSAALFFVTYETIKSSMHQQFSNQQNNPFIHMFAASCGEIIACLVRVPVEIAKQRKQASLVKRDASSFKILYQAYKTEGLRKGVYRGFGITIMREVPFSFIQFPLWEYLKLNWEPSTGLELNPFYVAICGAISGGIAAGLTTPLDLLKTRIMLADINSQKSIPRLLKSIYLANGLRGLFAGFVPRVMWITLGGAVFFGFYDLTTRIISSNSTSTYER
jgi:solute carrier family 25 S-adenosylmethionine transporter 26